MSTADILLALLIALFFAWVAWDIFSVPIEEFDALHEEESNPK